MFGWIGGKTKEQKLLEAAAGDDAAGVRAALSSADPDWLNPEALACWSRPSAGTPRSRTPARGRWPNLRVAGAARLWSLSPPAAEFVRLLLKAGRTSPATTGRAPCSVAEAGYRRRPLLWAGARRRPTATAPRRSSAALNRHEELCGPLLGRGADPRARNVNGRTPLMAAAVSGSGMLVKMLLDKGADPAARDADGLSAADLAGQEGLTAVAEQLAAAGTPASAPGASGGEVVRAVARLSSGAVPERAALDLDVLAASPVLCPAWRTGPRRASPSRCPRRRAGPASLAPTSSATARLGRPGGSRPVSWRCPGATPCACSSTPASRPSPSTSPGRPCSGSRRASWRTWPADGGREPGLFGVAAVVFSWPPA